MSSSDPVLTIRHFRRRRPPSSATRMALVGVLIVFVAAIGLAIMLVAQTLSVVTRGLPDVGVLEGLWGPLGREAFAPAQLLDRSGEHVLYAYLVETPEEVAWVRVRTGAENAVPQHTIDAVLAAVDPGFWDSSAYSLESLLEIARAILRPTGGVYPGDNSIAASLAAASLVPLTRTPQDEWADPARRLLLAAEISNRFSKITLLEWYLNSACFGPSVYGLDTAAQHYFGLHANELDLGQSAALAAMLVMQGDPRAQLDELAAEQQTILGSMVAAGSISRTAAQQAAWVDAESHFTPGFAEAQPPALAVYVEDLITHSFGAAIMGRPALRIRSTVDYDLQIQVDCAAETHLQRLNGGDASSTTPAEDGSACIAAGLLPTLRPGDAGLSHGAEGADVVVLENATGQILALRGEIETARAAGASLYPFLYLTAFSQGYAPGSMILDIAEENGDGIVEGEGPVLMRTALRDGLRAAASRLLGLVGQEALERTLASMGIHSEFPGRASQSDVDLDRFLLSPLDAAFSYSAFANQGVLAGSPLSLNGGLRPAAILMIENADGDVLYTSAPQERAVVSAQLAYLIVDILRDAPTRLARGGQGSALDLGRAAMSMISETRDGMVTWTIGSTPDITVAVSMEAAGSESRDLVALNGPAVIWHGVLRYATREDDPFEEWSLPAGISELDICSPSGLLPTSYCPEVVSEVFLQGTEPTQVDQLYQPVRVNRETGNLATLYTPPELVEERIYLIPPGGAEAWAEAAGIDLPPVEYDAVQVEEDVHPDVDIQFPEQFDIVRGMLRIRGRVRPEGLEFYRIQVGEGLNPTEWIQAGDDVGEAVYSGLLGDVDTEGLNGLYTIQLLAVLDDGFFITDAVTVTIDNHAPEISILAPDTESVWELQMGDTLRIQVNAQDDVGIGQVVLYIDNRRLAELDSIPYTFLWQPSDVGEHVITARAYDLAGNFENSEPLRVDVMP